jgi:hypothetical protein
MRPGRHRSDSALIPGATMIYSKKARLASHKAVVSRCPVLLHDLRPHNCCRNSLRFRRGDHGRGVGFIAKGPPDGAWLTWRNG